MSLTSGEEKVLGKYQIWKSYLERDQRKFNENQFQDEGCSGGNACSNCSGCGTTCWTVSQDYVNKESSDTSDSLYPGGFDSGCAPGGCGGCTGCGS